MIPTKQVDDAANSERWLELIRKFNVLTKEMPDAKKVKDELLNLKQEAKNSSILTYRQVDAITARCDNYLNGTYGNTKRPEHYEQGKPEKNK